MPAAQVSKLHSEFCWYAEARRALIACTMWFAALAAWTQAKSPAPASANPPPASTQAQPTQQKLPRVTTTVVVHGEPQDDYLPESVTVGTLDGAPLAETPVSATEVTRELLNDQQARVLSDVVEDRCVNG